MAASGTAMPIRCSHLASRITVRMLLSKFTNSFPAAQAGSSSERDQMDYQETAHGHAQTGICRAGRLHRIQMASTCHLRHVFLKKTGNSRWPDACRHPAGQNGLPKIQEGCTIQVCMLVFEIVHGYHTQCSALTKKLGSEENKQMSRLPVQGISDAIILCSLLFHDMSS